MNTRFFSVICDLFFLAFGCWTLLQILFYFMGFSFIAMVVCGAVIIPLQSIATKGASFRHDRLCRADAISSVPVPVYPSISTVLSLSATWGRILKFSNQFSSQFFHLTSNRQETL